MPDFPYKSTVVGREVEITAGGDVYVDGVNHNNALPDHIRGRPLTKDTLLAVELWVVEEGRRFDLLDFIDGRRV